MKNILIELKDDIVLSPKEDTRYVLSFPEFTDNKAYSVTLNLEKEGISAEMISLYKLYSKHALKLTTVSHHKVPNTKCTTVVKGVLFDGCSSDYIGKIIIEKKAQQTSSYLDDAILVVGEDTKNNSQPILQIDADDVKASHGATTGRISEEQLYYLMARGLSKKDAEETIVTGFFETLLSRIDDDIVKNEVLKRLNA